MSTILRSNLRALAMALPWVCSVLTGCCPLGPGASAAAPPIAWARLPDWSINRYRPAPVAADPDLPANWPETRWNRYIAMRMQAQSEVSTPDGSRADLVTTAADGTRTACEIDFAPKWNQAVAGCHGLTPIGG